MRDLRAGIRFYRRSAQHWRSLRFAGRLPIGHALESSSIPYLSWTART